MQIIMLPQTLAPLSRDQVSYELCKLIPGGRLDNADVDRVMGVLALTRAELYGAERLDANETMVFTQMLEHLRARTADIKRPEYKGRLLVPLTTPFASKVNPNFVAMITRSRPPSTVRSARANSCSLVKGPYASAVSKKVHPSSIAR